MRSIYLLPLLLLPLHSFSAEEVIPYASKQLRSAGSGFLQLIGPGEMVVKGKKQRYRKGKYIRSANIHSLSDIEGISSACILHYASHDYATNITVRHRCTEVIEIINSVEKGKDPDAMQLKLPPKEFQALERAFQEP